MNFALFVAVDRPWSAVDPAYECPARRQQNMDDPLILHQGIRIPRSRTLMMEQTSKGINIDNERSLVTYTKNVDDCDSQRWQGHSAKSSLSVHCSTTSLVQATDQRMTELQRQHSDLIV